MSLSSRWLAYLARLNIIRSKALLEGAALRTPIAVAQILERRPTCRVLLSLHDLSVYSTCMLHDTHAAAGVLRLMSKHPEESPAHGDNCLRVAVDVSTVHTDVCCFFLLCGRQPAPKTRRNGPLGQSLYVDVLVLSLHLQSMDKCFKHHRHQPSRHYKHDSLQPHICLSKRGGMQKTDHSIAEIS